MWLKELPNNFSINIGYEPENEKKAKYFLYKLDYRKKKDKKLRKEFQNQKVLLLLKKDEDFLIVDACPKKCWNI